MSHATGGALTKAALVSITVKALHELDRVVGYSLGNCLMTKEYR